MGENLILITILGTALLYSLGGMFLKPIRRYGIPLLFIIVSIITGGLNMPKVYAILLTCGALHLGYGSNSSWFMRIVYALAISLPTLIIGFNFWCVILPIVFLTTYYFSNKPKWQYIFNWRICEALTGIFLGILWSQIIGR